MGAPDAATVAPYAAGRSDYGNVSAGLDGSAAGTRLPMGGVVTAVREGSPADDAGVLPGMVVTRVEGAPLTDMVTWLWEADGDEVRLEVFDPRDATATDCVLERLPGEDWGISFDGAVFDGMRTCRNACVFCFMGMLPPHMRRSLYIRDDDYRLSFLEGNFVTLTNLTDDDVDRIVTCRLSPMNVSLHAVSPAVRRRLMGRNADRGLEVLERLVAADIEIHAQIVLCPDLNDGDELDRTLAWCEARPQVTSLGIVPLGYTRFSRHFDRSFSDDPARARRVIDQVKPYQERARDRYGRTCFQLSDEFYLDAGIDVPAAEHYDGYPQFYDGIGMIRSYLDETDEVLRSSSATLDAVRDALERRGLRLSVVSGMAAAPTVERFVEELAPAARVIAIENRFFGGNVDVTGLICGCDLLEQVGDDLRDVMLILPDVMFNSDGMTLDGYHQQDLLRTLADRGARVLISSTQPAALLDALSDELG